MILVAAIYFLDYLHRWVVKVLGLRIEYALMGLKGRLLFLFPNWA